MRVLIACEESQEVCKAFRARGHEAYSCDIQPCSGGHPEWHIIADVLTVINGGSFITEAGTVVVITKWDKMIAHPMCTYLTISAEWAYADPDYIRYPNIGYHQKVKPGTLVGLKRRVARNNALEFVCKLLNAPIDKIVIENPIGVISTRVFKHIDGTWKVFPNSTRGCIEPQIIQPYQFGDDASKSTALYMVNVNKLRPTKYIQPRVVNGKKRWANQTDSGQNKLGPSDDRAKIRSKTFPGIAKAMAEQWG